jgi:AraC family transcriptional activator of pobA
MGKHKASIPIANFGGESGAGINIERVAFDSLPDLGDWEQPERHDRHSFFLVEQGSATLEIDFQQYQVQGPSVVYMHPDQVHRIIAFEDIIVYGIGINNESLNPAYLKLLEETNAAGPIPLNNENFLLLQEAASLALKLSWRKKDQLQYAALKDSCNAFVSIMISLYLEMENPAGTMARAEQVTRFFRQALARQFTKLKRPADYAEQLNLSTPYLNECVKASTGQPVTFHIQQRVILEAKRLLFHSDCSLKEIAGMLGFDDYAYFSRLFARVTGKPPLAFRRENLVSSKSNLL